MLQHVSIYGMALYMYLLAFSPRWHCQCDGYLYSFRFAPFELKGRQKEITFQLVRPMFQCNRNITRIIVRFRHSSLADAVYTQTCIYIQHTHHAEHEQ